jgi:delta(3,5)-delta(2,4)-dienoyl-CoA isomerase
VAEQIVLESRKRLPLLDFLFTVQKYRDSKYIFLIFSSGNGKIFTSGIDLTDLSSLAAVVYGEEDVARKANTMYHTIRRLQGLFTRLEACPKPVIGAVHSACVGGGVDLITATDIRVCTRDAWFQVKEVDMGLAADVGTLQRLPKIVGSQSLVSELCLTARKMAAAEAASCGMVSTVYETREEMMSGALGLAATIASKSPVAVQGTKISLVYAREHSTEEGLEQVARYNMAMLQSEDLMKAAMSQMDKSSPPPVFAKL